MPLRVLLNKQKQRYVSPISLKVFHIRDRLFMRLPCAWKVHNDNEEEWEHLDSPKEETNTTKLALKTETHVPINFSSSDYEGI